MAAISGLLSTLAWTGYTGLYTSSSFIKPYRFTIDVQGGTFPATGMNGSGVVVTSNKPLPYSWGGSITARMPSTPASGYSANVSWGSGNHALNVREWNLDVTWAEKDVTAFDGSGINARSFIPLIASWRGSYTGYVDGGTGATLPTLPGGTIQTLTLKALESGVTDDTFSGTAVVTQYGADVGVETGGEYTYQFEGDGQLSVPAAATYFGVNSNGIFDDSAGTLLTPTAGSLVLTATTSRTFTGDAFPVGFSVRANVTAGIECTIRYRGTGALSIA